MGLSNSRTAGVSAAVIVTGRWHGLSLCYLQAQGLNVTETLTEPSEPCRDGGTRGQLRTELGSHSQTIGRSEWGCLVQAEG